MNCPSCHFENPSQSIFCSKCGAELSSPEEISSIQTIMAQTTAITMGQGSTFAGKYSIIKELGRGGMGVVYEAEDIKLRRHVALKFLPPGLTQDTAARERFIQEAQAASKLDHQNICTIYEIDESEAGEMYISMACYKGQSLKDKIKQRQIELKDALDIAIQIAEGLDKAHGKGIVHRDIKPANILMTEEGVAKIVDFGLAKLAGQLRLTRSGSTMGTIAYMSPEQAQGLDVDHRTDIWSLGVVIYEMITGQLPFKGESELAYFNSVLKEDPEPIREPLGEAKSEIEQILKKALTKDRSRRFSSGKEIAEALRGLRLRLFPDAYTVKVQPVARRPLRQILIGVTAGVLITAAVFTIWMSTRPGLAFHEQDKLLVADVDNQTGEAVFDMALRTAIEADLQQSPYASIFDKGQIAETLRLMREEPTARIDEDLGIKICRFAGVRALILPRMISAGEAYELQAILVDPVRKRHVDRIRVTALGREEVLMTAIDKLARQVRTHLGESIESIEKADMPVIQATTSSWEALQLLTLGKEKWEETKFKEAVSLFELALEEDPHFAAAKGSMGLVLLQFLNQKEKGKEMLRQALEDAKDLPQKEYLMIKAVNKQFVDEDLKGALDEYRMISEVYPDVWVAKNNAALILRSLGRIEEAIDLFEEAAEDALPNSLPLTNLWFTYLYNKRDPKATEEVAKRLLEIGPEIANFHHFYGWSLVTQGRFEEALEAYKRALELEPQHPYALPNAAHLLLATGRASEAVTIYRQTFDLALQGEMIGPPEKNAFDLALALVEAGEQEEAIEIAEQGKSVLFKRVGDAPLQASDLLLLSLLEAISGRLEEAEDYLNKALPVDDKDAHTLLRVAEVYAVTGRESQAIEKIRQALESGYRDYYFPLIFPAFQSIRDDPQFRDLFGVDYE